MQHNSWKKDRNLLSEAYTQINENEGMEEVIKKLSEDLNNNILPSMNDLNYELNFIEKEIDLNNIIDSLENLRDFTSNYLRELIE